MATSGIHYSTILSSERIHRKPIHLYPSINRKPISNFQRIPSRPSYPLIATSATAKSGAKPSSVSERVFFDGGAHYGDLVTNLLLGFTLLWVPLTLAAVSRAFYLRYRFTDRRVTVVSGLSGQDRSDFEYKVIKNVQVVPRFLGEWGDIVITLKDGTVVDLRSVPMFREIADYCRFMAKESSSS